MSNETKVRAGGCLCGAIRFQARGEPIWVAHCHCKSCRRTTASAMTTYAGFRPDQVTFSAGEPTQFNSSPNVTRSFCPRCGTPISYRSERWPDEIHLFVCTFDEPASFAPRAHVYTRYQLPWLHLNDGLRRYDATS